MGERTCSAEECVKPVVGRDLCRKHYVRWYRAGGQAQIPAKPSFEERFWSRVAGSDPLGCWEWTGSLNSIGGYGQIRKDDRLFQAHRVAWELLRSEIPEGLQLDHLCRNRGCVNPWHLEPVSQRVNILRGESLSARWAARTACEQGHELTPDNIYWRGNARLCRECTLIRMRTTRSA